MRPPALTPNFLWPAQLLVEGQTCDYVKRDEAMLIDPPLWAWLPASGRYVVHPDRECDALVCAGLTLSTEPDRVLDECSHWSVTSFS